METRGWKASHPTTQPPNHPDRLRKTTVRIPHLRLVLIGATLLVVTAIHWATDPHLGLLHGILGHLYLLPVLTASFWFGLKGGLGAAVLSSLLYAPHLFLLRGEQAHGTLEVYNVLEIVLYLIIGSATGFLSENERRQREKTNQALAELRLSHERLREQSEALLKTEQELRRADRLSALGELAASMAHEIRTPLGSIRGAVEILGDAISKDDPRHEFVGILVTEADRLNRYVETVLEYARPPRLARTACDVNELVRSMATLVAKQAQQAKVRIHLECDEALPEGFCDAGLVRHALMNLVLNALQAMPEGGGMTLRTRSGRDGEIVIEVSDTGPGIPEDLRERLFQPFATSRPGGTGLGLSIARRIAEQHGGSLTFETPGPRGTVFRLALAGRAAAAGSAG